jgi:ATP-dependent helicase/nuclease subunit A
MRRVLCSASAGTGKTHQLCEEVAAQIRGGLAPERVLGVTFTVKAAAELKTRVQQRLLDDPTPPEERLERAERLELALLGTVHGIGLRLLQRFALRMGLSPRLDVMDEVAAERLLDESLALLPEEGWNNLAEAGLRMGIRDPKRLAKALLEVQRGNRLADPAVREGLAQGAERVCQLLSPEGPDPAAGDLDSLRREAKAALDRLDAHQDGFKKTEQAREVLRKMDRTLAWSDAVALTKVAAATSKGADDALEPLRERARALRRMPGLHADVRAYAALLAEQTLALGAAYDQRKRARGVLDFADLEALFLDALELPEAEEDIRALVGLVVVDEFQDTNPMQLAIFARLHAIVGNSVWVGDQKQAIYGFRGADSELMEVVWSGGEAVYGARTGAPDLLAEALHGPGDEAMHLATNRRSQRGLVEVFNHLFEGPFGKGALLQPHRPPTPAGVERWRIPAGNFDEEHAGVAAGIRALRDEGHALRDIGVLVRTNARAAALGATLRKQGLPVVLPLPGLLRRRETATALAGLRVVADRWDGVACAEVLHHLSDAAEEPAWLARRLQETRGGARGKPFADDPTLAALEALPLRTMAPREVLAAVVAALDLPARLAAWGSPGQRAAHLDALLDLAGRLESLAIAEGRAPTLTGLVQDLRRAAEEGEDHLPVPRGIEAVTVLTYHGAKGLEWPVVVLTDLDAEARPDPWRLRAVGGAAKAGKPLEGRALHAWLWPLGTNNNPKGFDKRSGGTGLEDDALASPEGERIRDAEAEEAKRLLYVGMTRARDKLVLVHRHDKGKDHHQWLDVYPAVRDVVPCGDPGEHPIEGASTGLRVRELRGLDRTPPALGTRWLAEPPPMHEPRVARVRNPSAEVAPAVAAFGPAADLGPRARVRALRDMDKDDALGSAIHAYLAALPSLRSVGQEARLAAATHCLRGFDVAEALLPQELVQAGARFEAWVQQRWPGARWHTEVALRAPAPDGAQWVGTADLLLQLPDGRVVVVDHKGTPLPESRWGEKAAGYAGQLHAYTLALEAQGIQVAERWVHLPTQGKVVPLPR